MRQRLMRGLVGVIGIQRTVEQSKVDWDTSVGAVAAFATLVASLLLWEPTLSVARVSAWLSLSSLCVMVAFRRRLVAAGCLAFVAIRWLIAAGELRSLKAAIFSLAFAAAAAVLALWRNSELGDLD